MNVVSDRLSELLVPTLIERFDAIPSDQTVTVQLTKGEIAYLIKSHYQLHNGLALVLTALGDAIFTTDLGTRALVEASQTLQNAQQSMTHATNSLIERVVRTGSRES